MTAANAVTATNQLSLLLVAELQAELAKTRRFLERVPEGQNDFKPHDRSRTLLELVNHIATVTGLPAGILTHSRVELGGPTAPRRIVNEPNVGAVLPVFDERAAQSLAQLQGTTDEALGEQWQASQNGQVRFAGTRYAALRNLAMNHLIHHRAQLGEYLRLLDIPVPVGFGPSADESPY